MANKKEKAKPSAAELWEAHQELRKKTEAFAEQLQEVAPLKFKAWVVGEYSGLAALEALFKHGRAKINTSAFDFVVTDGDVLVLNEAWKKFGIQLEKRGHEIVFRTI